MSVGKAPREQNLTNQPTMNRKSLVKASYFFFDLGSACICKRDDERYDVSEDEYDELTDCAHAWLMLEAYLDRVLD